MLKDRMDDASRFARFVRREAADYHDPPEAPVESMWAGIEAGLGAPPVPVPDSPETADMTDAVAGSGGAVGRPFDVLGYHDPPPAPRETMWERIEAEWVARQPEDPGARTAVRRPLRMVVARTLGRRPGRTTWWLTGAAAASVALAVAIDGGSRLPVSAGPESVAVTTAPEPAGVPSSVVATGSGPLAATAAEGVPSLSVAEEPLETKRLFADARPPSAAGPAPSQTEADRAGRDAVSSPSPRPAGPGRASTDEYDMSRISRHLDRTQALLVAFRTDIGTDESERDLAKWAREFLVETRSLLSTPAAEGQRERALLQDLELVLVQIARLGPDAPGFERELARESMERQGTLLRLRAANGT